MSTHLSIEPFSIAPGATQATVKSTIDNKLIALGWQRVTNDTTNQISDFIPPSSETVGDGAWRQHLRIYYNTADISFSMYDYPIVDAVAQQYRIVAKTGGAVAAAITIGSTTVTGATGSAGSTANDNLYALYYELTQSVASDVTGWQITYHSRESLHVILLERKTISGTLVTFTPNANVTGATQSEPVLAGGVPSNTIAAAALSKYSVTIDRTNGFYCYMSVFSRSITLSVKTITTVSNVIFGTWQKNADALAALPATPSWLLNNPCRITEGVYGTSTGTAAAPGEQYNVRSSNAFMMSQGWTYVSTSAALTAGGNVNSAGGGGTIAGIIQSYQANGHYSNTIENFTADPLGFTTGYAVDGIFDVFGMVLNPTGKAIGNMTSYACQAKGRMAGIPLDDIFCASAANDDASEVTCVAGVKSATSYSLQQNLDNTSSYTSLLLNTTTGLAAAGYVVLDREVFSYTGTSGGNTLTGVTRAYNGTPMLYHFTGEQVTQGVWFIKLGGAYMYAGTTRPTAS